MRFLLILLSAASLAAAGYMQQREQGPGRGGSPTTEVQHGQTGTLISFPPLQTNTGTLPIPDAAHPFVAPGPNDQRGPCPGMNTLANHGYIPRNGIATFEDILTGMMDAYNIEPNFGAFLVAANMLLRGNPFINKVSIGGVSPLVPGLPGGIASKSPGGIALHGGFEGDASMTRADVHTGDNKDFQAILYDMDLLQLGKFGDNGPDGNSTLFNVNTLAAIKRLNIVSNQASDPDFALPIRRFNAMFTEASFLLNIFANGTTKEASLSTIGSFFRNQTFPANWHRAAAPATGAESSGDIAGTLLSVFPIAPGHNENGVYVLDPSPPAPFNSSLDCETYFDLFANMPGTLANTTGLFLENVKFLSAMVQNVFSSPDCNVTLLPFGPPVD